MESALCFRCYPLSTLPLRVPSAGSTATANKLQFAFSHSSLSFSNVSTRRPLAHVISPVIRAVDRFSTLSTNEDDNANRVRGAVGASMVLACILGVFSCSCKVTPKAIAAGPSMYLVGPKTALKSLLEVNEEILASPKPPPTRPTFFKRKSIDPAVIKMEAMQLMKSGKGAQAEELLKTALKKLEGDDDSSYYVKLSLVEILIRQRKYEKAMTCCESIKDDHTNSDGRLILYKAITYTMSDKTEDAVDWWKKFIDVVEKGGDPPM